MKEFSNSFRWREPQQTDGFKPKMQMRERVYIYVGLTAQFIEYHYAFNRVLKVQF